MAIQYKVTKKSKGIHWLILVQSFKSKFTPFNLLKSLNQIQCQQYSLQIKIRHFICLIFSCVVILIMLSHRNHLKNYRTNIEHDTNLSKLLQHDFQQKLKLQGQKKVIEYELLQLSTLKIIFLGIPLMLSIIGLYLLLKKQAYKISIFYIRHTEFVPQKITHLWIKKNDNSSEIASINREQFAHQIHYTFTTQLLKYEITEKGVCPVASNQIYKLAQTIRNQDELKAGLTTSEFEERLSFYGANEHKVQIPDYFFYMAEILTEPLFVLQYCIFAVWIIRYLFANVIANFLFCLVVTSVNYLILYYNFNKVKQMAQKKFNVQVIRNKELITVNNTQIVPGDIYVVEKDIPCDSVVVQGDLLVNQVNFTGQNLPILKYKLENIYTIKNNHHWIYQGSEVVNVRGQCLAKAIHTGYTSHRGRIIRKIIKHNVQEPIFTHHILIFFVTAYFLAGCVYFSYISKLVSLPIREDTMVFLFFQIVSLAVPVGFVGVVNFLPGLSLIRLDLQQIYGKQPYKVYQSANINTICFDKTGTITQNSLILSDIYSCNQNETVKITETLQKYDYIYDLFASCHMVKQISDQALAGDEVDLRMFVKTNSKILSSQDPNILWQIKTKNNVLSVLRINQFESKHMSMSVLVREQKSKKLIVFVKGSPEIIYRQCLVKTDKWLQITKQLSFQGFRTIGMAYKVLKPSQQPFYRQVQRDKYLQSLQMLGIASFLNKLKDDTVEVIHRLRTEVGLSIKMITGDNIFTAVQTAFKSGIINKYQTVVICEQKSIIQFEYLKSNAIIVQQPDQGVFSEREVIINDFQQFLRHSANNFVFAIESIYLRQFIYKKGLIDKIKVFARVSPQNKIQIIKHLKSNLQSQYSDKSTISKLFGSFRKNIVMVGDGANDLMAIKEADVGIGISQSDGTFSADFVVTSLSQIQQIIRQGKSISKLLIQGFLIYFLNTCLYIPLMLLSVHDLCSFSQQTMFYKNIAFNIFLPFFLGLCKPLKKNTQSSPEMNVFSLSVQSKIWTNILIFSVGFCWCFEYYWRSDDVQIVNRGWVTMTDSFTTYSKTSTLCFKLIVAHCIAIIFNIYTGKPWKQPINKNCSLFIWLVFNIVVGLVLYFNEKTLGLLKLATMKNSTSFMVLMIMLTTSIVSLVVMEAIQRFEKQERICEIESESEVKALLNNV